ncbi:hypothetical protein Q5H92_22755 [Hymenobacter sp. M29]|uniref:Uncharacterized protein n=1 Tax=Hymenobacter mellowenesis TaxID=3063995 RepID=A0ABT9AK75_9BACT|nr:hypothetical protein [Hymenobacter sp. M29]MDO7849202.1 hypothetical protein [Hymenobacter sp. M29]
MLFTIPSMVGSEPAKVNLKELGIVREQHMPAHVVRFAPAEELVRVREETSREHPHLREELLFVEGEELGRRARLSQSPLVAVKGGLRCG